MSRTRFVNPHRSDPTSRFWLWRDLNRAMRAGREDDQTVADAFDERANELIEQIEFLLSAGLSDGSREALTALAEEDMTDFCILVDLADEHMETRFGVLSDTARRALDEFLSEPPWKTLAVDHDITVALALLDEVGGLRSDQPWYRFSPGLAALTGRVLDHVNTEQLNRFVGEYNLLAERDHLQLPADFSEVLQAQLNFAAARLGIRPPNINTG